MTNVRHEFMQRLCVVHHGAMGSDLRDALQEVGASVVVCLRAPRA
jgi:hypothetical protein